MISAKMANKNYTATTAMNTALVMDSVLSRHEVILEKIEQVIIDCSSKGLKSMKLRFPINNGTVQRKDIYNNKFCQGELSPYYGAYCMEVFADIVEGYTNVKIPVDSQRDFILNTLRDAGYTVSRIGDNHLIEWA